MKSTSNGDNYSRAQNQLGKLADDRISVADSVETGTRRHMRRRDSESSMISGVSQAHTNLLDSNRIERVLQTFKAINNCKKMTDILKLTLKELKSLISFSNCTIFIVQKAIIEGVMGFKPDVDNVNVSTIQLDSKNLKAISEQETMAQPAFQKFDEVRYGIKT